MRIEKISSEDKPSGRGSCRNSLNEFGEMNVWPRDSGGVKRNFLASTNPSTHSCYTVLSVTRHRRTCGSSHVSLPSLGHVTVKPSVDSTCQPAIEDRPLPPFGLETSEIRLTSHRIRICVEFVSPYRPFRFIFAFFDCSYVPSFIPSVHLSTDTLSSRRISYSRSPWNARRRPIYFPSAIFMHAPFFAEPPLFFPRLTFIPKGARSWFLWLPRESAIRILHSYTRISSSSLPEFLDGGKFRETSITVRYLRNIVQEWEVTESLQAFLFRETNLKIRFRPRYSVYWIITLKVTSHIYNFLQRYFIVIRHYYWHSSAAALVDTNSF